MKKFFATGFATLLLLGVLTVSALAATTEEHQKHDMGAMTQESMDGHDMNTMGSDSQSGHDMNNMSHEGHGNKKTTENDNPWPVLYGFGGAILAVITIAGIMKFSRRKGQGVK